MLGVFLHAGFAVQTHTECGTVYLRFEITPTESYRLALAVRAQTRQIAPRSPASRTSVWRGAASDDHEK
jgi:hypothetical protein